MKTCGTCTEALWERTPTGRIKKHIVGHCKQASVLLAEVNNKCPAPCLAPIRTWTLGVWPDYPADHCPKYKAV